MHSYCKTDDGKRWQVGYQTDEPRFYPLGPKFNLESDAAAFASFLNGGRYNPYEIEALFRTEPAVEPYTNTYERPQGMDYEPEAARK